MNRYRPQFFADLTEKCVLIAEIGVNHNGSVDLAKRTARAALESGADAVKFQIFKTEELVTRETEKARYQKETMGAEDVGQWNMLKSLELSQDQHREVSEYCAEIGITYICTPYDLESARFLATNINVAAIKVASSDTTNVPFLKGVDTLGRPIILSTGMCTMDEVRAAVESLPNTLKHRQLCILQCTSEYPAPAEEANLRAMRSMAQEFECPVGFSDHTVGIEVAALAVAHGAVVIEKHFTLDKSLPGPDHRASSEPEEFAALVAQVRRVERILGSAEKTITPAESANKNSMQKSLYYKRDMKPGDILKADDIAYKRPSLGLKPSDADQVIGRRMSVNVQADHLIDLAHFSKRKG